MAVKEAHRLNLTQCLEIEANQFRSKDARRDYDRESVLDRINWINSRKDYEESIKALKELEKYSDELPPPLPPECDEGIPENEWLFI